MRENNLKYLRRNFALFTLVCAAFAFAPSLQSIADSDIPKPSTKPHQRGTKTHIVPSPPIKPQTLKTKVEGLVKPTYKPEQITRSKKQEQEPPIKTVKNSKYKKRLKSKNSNLYREIFSLQKKGQMSQADAKIKKLGDKRLIGHVLHQRYMHPAYNSSFKELKEWLILYGDHPRAQKIYDLAQRKKPENFKGTLKKPQSRAYIARRIEPTMVRARHYISPRQRSAKAASQAKKLKARIERLVRVDRPSEALQALKDNGGVLDNIEYDIARARISASYLYNGKTEEAFEQASQSAKRSGLYAPVAGWVAGLVSWMNKDYRAAAQYFEITGRSNYASSWTKSAGSYWAARSHMRMGNVKEISTWLNRANEFPRTFYGLIATRALGRDFDFDWRAPTFTKENYKILVSTPAGARAAALSEIGQITRAESELIRMKPTSNEMRSALLSFASYAKIPGVALRLGTQDAAIYPLSPWKPQSGYKIDRALVHAIMRQESRFDPLAQSPSGALGLMQLIPSTARSVGLQHIDDLAIPEINLELGQHYLLRLQSEKSVGNDIFNLLIAYNGGPGNLQKWKRRWPNVNDPLLFVELIPSGETRAYVERVVSNYWIYRLRDNFLTPTLDAVTSGNNAQYAVKSVLK